MKHRKMVAMLLCCLFALGNAGVALADDPVASIAPDGDAAYEICAYIAQPDIRIAYPSFAGNDALNALVDAEVQSLVPEDTTGATIDYNCAVTLLNSRFASMVFWGYSDVEGAAHPYTDIATLNVDLTEMRQVTLGDLYTVNDEFEQTFFGKASFPSKPVTSYSAEDFSNAMEMEMADCQMYNPFSVEEGVICFLKPDGLVLSMPAVHASGSDHFEAQLAYGDVQSFYLLSQNVWED